MSPKTNERAKLANWQVQNCEGQAKRELFLGPRNSLIDLFWLVLLKILNFDVSNLNVTFLAQMIFNKKIDNYKVAYFFELYIFFLINSAFKIVLKKSILLCN